MPLDVEVYQGTGRFTDPVHLLGLEPLAVVDLLEARQQPFGVGGNAQAPLQHGALLHGVVAALAAAVLHFVVGQHGAQGFAPVYVAHAAERQAVVHQHVAALPLAFGRPLPGGQGQRLALGGVQPRGAVCVQVGNQFTYGPGAVGVLIVPVLEDAADDPLRPLEVVRVGGIDAAVPVEAQSEPLHLLAVAGGIAGGRFGGVHAGINGVLFGGQAKGIEAHRVQYVVAGLPLLPRYDIGTDVPQRVTYVQPRARGIREHIEYVVFRLIRGVGRPVGFMLLPVGLPFAVEGLHVKFHRSIYLMSAQR